MKIKLQKRSFFFLLSQKIDFNDGVLFVKKVPDKFGSIGCLLKQLIMPESFVDKSCARSTKSKHIKE